MKAHNFLNDKWTGTIIYGKKYGLMNGKELHFDLELNQEGENIKGKSIDIGGVGKSSDSATIAGKFDGRVISFVKQYASLHYYDNEETLVDKSQSGLPIYYNGIYNEEQQSFSGEWEYRIKYKKFRILPMIYICGGTWTMRRK